MVQKVTASPYSDFVERLFLVPEMLERVFPTDVLEVERLIKLREISDAELFEGKEGDEGMRALTRALLFYYLDSLPEAERLANPIRGDHAHYVRGMIFRRQGDMENCREAYSSAGSHPVFHALHRAASEKSSNMAKQFNWDPYMFTLLVEQYKFAARDSESEIRFLQRLEFQFMFEFTWRKATGVPPTI